MAAYGPRVLLRVSLACAAALLAGPLLVGEAAAAGTHFYVDGKLGSDANAGTSLGTAFKTVEKALESTKVAGVTISIVGYTDYTYYETLERPYKLPGTSTEPIIIEGYHGSGTFVRPTISGALVVNNPGSTRWTRPNPTTYPNVWRTTWTTPIKGYEAANKPNRMERLFFDRIHQLTRPNATPTLADLQAKPGSQYWDGSYLYVHLGRWDGVAVDPDPNKHQIVIPHYFGIVANYLSSWVTIRDLQIVHAAPGIALHAGSHHMTVTNVDLSYNYPAGLSSQAADATITYVTGSRNTMQLIKIQDAPRNYVDHVTSRQNPAQGIKITGAGSVSTTVRASKFIEGQLVPAWVATYSGEVQGIDVEQGASNTLIQYNTITGMGRGLMLYQLDASGQALRGTVVMGNYFERNLHAVVLWDGKSGGASNGDATFHHNSYYNNGNAVFAPETTTNKWFHHETIYLTYEATGTARSAVLLQGTGTSVRFTDSIIARSPVYAIYAINGATAVVSYTDIYGYSKARSYGSVSWGTAVLSKDPVFASTTPGTTNFLYLGSTSPLLHASTTGGKLGSK